jgi:uncharacterized membrane protein YfcA
MVITSDGIWLGLMLAAFGGGMLNAVAGGGSFLTFPALLLAGLPPSAANATGTTALLPGYILGAWVQRREIIRPGGLGVVGIFLVATAGGALGAALLIWTGDVLFSKIVPWLMLFATLALWQGIRISQFMQKRGMTGPDFIARTGLFAVSVYGGYFNGGVGIVLLALFSAFGHRNLHVMNGAKNLASVALTGVAILVYASAHLVHWPVAFAMMAASAMGGWSGARIGQHVPPSLMRCFVVFIGFVLTGIFFVRM